MPLAEASRTPRRVRLSWPITSSTDGCTSWCWGGELGAASGADPGGFTCLGKIGFLWILHLAPSKKVVENTRSSRSFCPGKEPAKAFWFCCHVKIKCVCGAWCVPSAPIPAAGQARPQQCPSLSSPRNGHAVPRLGRCPSALTTFSCCCRVFDMKALLFPCQDECGCFSHRTFPLLQHRPVTHLLSVPRLWGCSCCSQAAPIPSLAAAHFSPDHPPPCPGSSHPLTPLSAILKGKAWMCNISIGRVRYDDGTQLLLPSIQPGLWHPSPVSPVLFETPVSWVPCAQLHWGDTACIWCCCTHMSSTARGPSRGGEEVGWVCGEGTSGVRVGGLQEGSDPTFCSSEDVSGCFKKHLPPSLNSHTCCL